MAFPQSVRTTSAGPRAAVLARVAGVARSGREHRSRAGATTRPYASRAGLSLSTGGPARSGRCAASARRGPSGSAPAARRCRAAAPHVLRHRLPRRRIVVRAVDARDVHARRDQPAHEAEVGRGLGGQRHHDAHARPAGGGPSSVLGVTVEQRAAPVEADRLVLDVRRPRPVGESIQDARAPCRGWRARGSRRVQGRRRRATRAVPAAGECRSGAARGSARGCARSRAKCGAIGPSRGRTAASYATMPARRSESSPISFSIAPWSQPSVRSRSAPSADIRAAPSPPR